MFKHLHADPHPTFATRRSFLTRTGSGCGLLALTSLLDQEGLLAANPVGSGQSAVGSQKSNAANPLAPHKGHLPSNVKSVIWLFMNGGPSQVDTWDYKPELAKRTGEELKGFDKDTGF